MTVTTSPQKKIMMVNTGESLSCSHSFPYGYTLIYSSQEHYETGTIVFSKTVTTENLQAGQLAQIHIQTNSRVKSQTVPDTRETHGAKGGAVLRSPFRTDPVQKSRQLTTSSCDCPEDLPQFQAEATHFATMPVQD